MQSTPQPKEKGMADELTYRCNDKKRFVVFVPVCRASLAKGKAKCLKGTCGFHTKRALSAGDGSGGVDISDGNRKIRRQSHDKDFGD